MGSAQETGLRREPLARAEQAGMGRAGRAGRAGRGGEGPSARRRGSGHAGRPRPLVPVPPALGCSSTVLGQSQEEY